MVCPLECVECEPTAGVALHAGGDLAGPHIQTTFADRTSDLQICLLHLARRHDRVPGNSARQRILEHIIDRRRRTDPGELARDWRGARTLRPVISRAPSPPRSRARRTAPSRKRSAGSTDKEMPAAAYAY